MFSKGLVPLAHLIKRNPGLSERSTFGLGR